MPLKNERLANEHLKMNIWKRILTGADHDVERELIESVLFIRIARAETERGH